MLLYLKVLWHNDARSIHPAGPVHYGPDPLITFAPPFGAPASAGGSFFRGDLLAVYVMSESGHTLDKIRGMTAEECGERPVARGLVDQPPPNDVPGPPPGEFVDIPASAQNEI